MFGCVYVYSLALAANTSHCTLRNIFSEIISHSQMSHIFKEIYPKKGRRRKKIRNPSSTVNKLDDGMSSLLGVRFVYQRTSPPPPRTPVHTTQHIHFNFHASVANSDVIPSQIMHVPFASDIWMGWGAFIVGWRTTSQSWCDAVEGGWGNCNDLKRFSDVLKVLCWNLMLSWIHWGRLGESWMAGWCEYPSKWYQINSIKLLSNAISMFSGELLNGNLCIFADSVNRNGKWKS